MRHGMRQKPRRTILNTSCSLGGNCQAGDRLVMEHKLKRFPNEKDLSEDFSPGVRFFFDYKKLCTHPNAVFEGVLPLKIKDEVILKDWVHAIVVPENERAALENHIPQNPAQKVHFVKNDCKDICGLVRKSV